MTKLCVYNKSQTHAANYCKFKLTTDIEKSPGPRSVYVDPNKTIAAPYSQGNEFVFGQNAGQQCVAMSLCCLIYNSKQGISSANDLQYFVTCRNNQEMSASKAINENNSRVRYEVRNKSVTTSSYPFSLFN